MLNMPKPTYILLALFLVSLLANHATAQPPTTPTYYDVSCRRTTFGNYTDTIYDSNLQEVLFGLQEQAPFASSSNYTAGSGEDTVYGQYYCRGDIDIQLCNDCIKEAAGSVVEKCPNARAAVMFYQECTLRYANQSMDGVYEKFPNGNGWSTENVSDPDKFGAVLRDTVGAAINKSVSSVPLHFAIREGAVSRFETVYLLAQCSPDLSGKQCKTCLLSGFDLMATCCGEWPVYLMVFFTSCQLRYSTRAAFYWPVLDGPAPVPALPPVYLMPPTKGKDASYFVIRAVVPAVVGLLILLIGVSFCLIKRPKRQYPSKPTAEKNIEAGAAETVETTDCVQFDLKTIEVATNSFSVANRLGQGGFGIVYQGILKEGQDIAVKRLSKNSGQGTEEFKTEVAVLAQLQHRNLVQLVGCCVDGEERLLVYEFLRNLSLDNFLFDEKRSAYLTWAVRHKIVQGIARGLHYLHEDSRVKIVHRDLKTSNILLDDNLDPKIADFGMARLVKMDQTAGNTMRVVGTYGYMAPEYALAGRYSTKSDVYSFGIIILEILSGKSNNKFYDASHGEGLLRYSWRVWTEGAIKQLMDPIVQNNYSRAEAERCLQIGVLCTQDDESNRPPMHAVLLMLSSNTVDLPPPFPPSHSTYIKKLSDSDDTQEGSSKLQVDDSGSSVALLSTQTDLSAR